MKRYKTIILTALILIVLLGVSLLLPSLLQGPSTSIQQEITTQSKVAEDTGVAEAQKAEGLKGLKAEEPEDEVTVAEVTVAETTVAEAEEVTVASVEDETVAQETSSLESNEETSVETTTVETTTAVIPEPNTEAPLDDEEPQDTVSWLDEQLAEYEGQVEEVDIETGIAIIEKLDVDYLNGLSEEGLTQEERIAVKTHLNEQLSESEYATALALYREYIGLLQ